MIVGCCKLSSVLLFLFLLSLWKTMCFATAGCSASAVQVSANTYVLLCGKSDCCPQNITIGRVINTRLGTDIVTRVDFLLSQLTLVHVLAVNASSNNSESDDRGVHTNVSSCLFGIRETDSSAHYHELDIADIVQFTMEVYISTNDVPDEGVMELVHLLPDSFWKILVTTDDPYLLTVGVHQEQRLHSRQSYTISVGARSVEQEGIVTMIVQPFICSVRTHMEENITKSIKLGCPTGKKLVFTYPAANTHLISLPVNYRPPSSLGVNLHQSPHVYHADPSQPLGGRVLQSLQSPAILKQCQNASQRSECNCTAQQVTSVNITFSDCISKVIRHLYSDPFPLNLSLTLSSEAINSHMSISSYMIQLEEMNNRSEFHVNGQRADKSYLEIKYSTETVLLFKGPGLYHFKASLLLNSSHCQNLTSQFIVFVLHTPLLQVTEYSISVVTSIGFGGAVLVAYLFYHHLHRHHQLV